MEKGNNRILAYHLSTPFTEEDLKQVSGGTQAHMANYRRCFRLSGGKINSIDIYYDVNDAG